MSNYDDSLSVGSVAFAGLNDPAKPTYIEGPRHAEVCTCAKCTAKRNRIAAFGAIRRAVSVARLYDNPDELFGPCADDAAKLDFDMTARTVRCAIRAAIGSDKA